MRPMDSRIMRTSNTRARCVFELNEVYFVDDNRLKDGIYKYMTDLQSQISIEQNYRGYT